MSEPKFYPLDKPNIINSISCRLSYDLEYAKSINWQGSMAIPVDEVDLILDIVDSAREYVKQFAPSGWEEAIGAGTEEGKKAAHENLVRAVRRDLI